MSHCKVCNKFHSDPLDTLVCCQPKNSAISEFNHIDKAWDNDLKFGITPKEMSEHYDKLIKQVEGNSAKQKDWVDEASEYLDKLNRPQQSARYNSGKVQLREIDPDFIKGLGEVLTASRAKYEEGNWQKETKFSTPYESCMRHLMKFWNGEELDEETGKHHLLHAATNLMFLYYHTDSGKGIDDRLFKKDKK